ncbi:MAG: DUF2089 domain-containing protein [Ardenticatenaceae bacterium]|nr:DUF2089 domain-containing protein [Anaerolineales bacterium]MCB8922793.1 DUF2089 domain-containing protein [Ardenticatenaceae bacterium]MCB8991926.1 DUF2089 domain-containing protein [Ardenticatenaceae bacterium]MCB9004736.1 DUF2089 domain-containing protein [Ardenticatenaceae bacterium]
MRKLLEHCPACGGEMVVTQMGCTRCETVVLGQFQPNIFSRLAPESLHFLEIFVKNKGNVKEMERETGWSYWTIRNRLNEIIEVLGFEAAEDSDDDVAQQRQEILLRLEKDEIDVDEASLLLQKLRP